MNYVAHLFLSPDDDAARIGALLADFCPGPMPRLEARFGPAIAAGIRHHREVDRYTDAHPLVQSVNKHIADDFGIYAGIVTDVMLDHVLVRRFTAWSTGPLDAFLDEVYRSLDRPLAAYPPAFEAVRQRLIQRRWLASYARLDTVAYALTRIDARFAWPTPLADALAGITRHQTLFDGLATDFFPTIIAHMAASFGVSSWAAR